MLYSTFAHHFHVEKKNVHQHVSKKKFPIVFSEKVEMFLLGWAEV